MSYDIKTIASIVEAKGYINKNQDINWLLTDSRSLTFNEGTLFFALRTKHNNGAKYIKELIERGVENFVVEKVDYKELSSHIGKETIDRVNFLVVDNSLKALQKLAKSHREKYDTPYVIGITGSNGKTVVKEWINQVIGASKRVVRSPRSYNSQIGVPLSVWQISKDTEVAIIEAGISKPNEMDKLREIIRPTIGLITNIGEAHQENFKSKREKTTEKLELFKGCDVIIYNADNKEIADAVETSMLTKKEIAWSKKNVDSPLFISKIDRAEDKTTIEYRYLELKDSFTIPFSDDASIENAINVLAVCLYLMIPRDVIKHHMTNLEPIAMRMEVKEGKNGCTLINDSYNSDLSSLNISLNFLARRSEKTRQKRTVILSDMLEYGSSSQKLYSNINKELIAWEVDKFIGVGKDISKHSNQFAKIKETYFFNTTEDLLNSKVLNGLHNESILIKGSRVFSFEEITEHLELKVHETILEVNLNAMIRNLNHYKEMLLSPHTKVVCMVKAYAYGAGFYEIAKTLQEHRVDYLAVAVADEGFELRKGGITSSIMVMNPEMSSFKTLFDYQLEPEVYSFTLLDQLIKAAEKEGVTKFPIHIKINSGMNRLGFLPDEIPQLIERLKSQSALIPRSVFSHLVGSDQADFDAFTHKQIDTFTIVANQLQDAFSHKILKHICNTAGIKRFPEAQMDMVRLGIGLYGIEPESNRIINNVSTLKTTIMQIHHIEKEETVGYSRMGKLDRTSVIAAIPIGYADGLDRRLGRGNAYCIVNGKKAKYVGNICMDVCMIDVTDIECNVGDKVIIFGDELPVTILSDKLETIPYEILTSISSRVKRVYYQD